MVKESNASELIECFNDLIRIEVEISNLRARLGKILGPRAQFGCWLQEERKEKR